MTDSQYPNALDDDRQLIRVDDNIVEIGGDAINGLRSAVFNIEQTLGVNPQGTAADMAARLNQSLNPDGTIKASALSTIGLVTLPITNSMVANNAGILESKLDLNYSTKNLRELIGALRVEHDALVLTVQGDITNLSRHVAHPSTFGRHRTSDIDGYIGKYVDYNLQGIVDDLDTRIMDHLSDPIDAHDASAISFDDTDTFINADEVQTAIEKLDALGVTTLTMHQDEQHSNGILSAQKTYEPNTFHGNVVVSSAALNAISSGATNVSYTSTPSTLSQVIRGDRIDITIDSNVYTRYVESIDSTFGVVNFFRALPVGGISPAAVIYRTTEEAFAPSTLQLAVRHDSISGNLGGSVLQLIHPSAPHILSNGLDVRAITASDKNIKIAWETGVTGDIDVYQALQTYPAANSTPSVWTPENLAIALNEEFKKDGNNYPLVAFVYKGEVGIAFDEPDGYVEFRAPSSNSAWAAFGLSGTEIDYVVTPRRFYLDGYSFSEIRKVVDATAITDNSTVIKNISADLTALGIGQTGIVRVKNHVDAGTYVFNASTSNSLTISSHIGNFIADTNVNIEIYADSFAVPIDTGIHTLFELFMDGYNHEYGELRGAARVEYVAGGGSTSNPETWFDIIDVSRNFAVGTKRINFQDVAGDKVVKLGTPVIVPPTSTDVTNPGEAYTLPTTNPVGHRFRLYDYNNVDYVDIEIADGAFSLIATDQAVDLTIYKRASEEKYVQIGQVLHDTDRFKYLTDRRLTGTVGRKDVRSDYTRDYVSYPRSLIRGNGVVYGCEVSGSVVVDGGQVLVDGNIYSIDRTEFSIPTDGTSSTYNVFVDSEGVLRFLKDNQDAAAGFATPSVGEIVASSDKTILAQVTINASGTVTEIVDLRRFVNNIDNKIELLVENNTISHGSFASLRAAVNYINVQGEQPVSHIIKIRGTYEHDLSEGEVILPNRTMVLGEGGFGDVGGSCIVLSGTNSTSFLIPGDSCTLKDLNVTYASGSYTSNIIGGASNPVSNFAMENCEFLGIRANTAISVIRGAEISRCKIENCRAVFDATAAASYANYFINTSSGNITDLQMTGCEIELSSLINWNNIINAGDISDSTIRDCNVSFPDTTGFNVPINCDDLTDVRFVDSKFSCEATNSYNLYLVSAENVSYFTVSGCHIIGFDKLTSFLSSTTDFYFTDNLVEADAAVTNLFNLNTTLANTNSVFVKNNMFRFSGISSSGSCVWFAGVNNLVFEGNVFSTTDTINGEAFKVAGNIENSVIKDNTFNMSTATWAMFTFSDYITNVIIDGNIISATANVTRFMYIGEHANNFTVSNNKFLNSAGSITAGIELQTITPGSSESIFILNNDFIVSGNTSYPIIDFRDAPGDIRDISIKGNRFVTGSANSSYRCISIHGAENVVIEGNIIDNQYTGTGTGYAIEVYANSAESKNIIVSNNVVTNSASNTGGYERGIQVWGGGNDITSVTISGNSISGIARSASGVIGIIVQETIGASITGNSVVDSKLCCEVNDCNSTVISGNYFETSVGNECLYLHGSGQNSVVVGNYIKSSATTTNSHLILSYAPYGLLANNLVESGHIGTALSGYAIYTTSTATNWTIKGNVIQNLAGGDYNARVVRCDGTGCLVAFNDMRRVSSAGGDDLIDIASNSYDYMNWGQTYKREVPLSNVILDTMTSSNGNETAWSYYSGLSTSWGPSYGASAVSWAQVSGGDGNDTPLIHHFGANLVPVGATIKSVEVTIGNWGGGATTDIHIAWYKGIRSTDDREVIRAEQDITSTSLHTETIVPDGSEPVMAAYNEDHLIEISFQAQCGDVTYTGMAVNYKL